MDWNLEGKRIEGVYLGVYPFKGRVVNSRVKFGGELQHEVELAQPIEIYGQNRMVLLIGNPEITKIN